MTTMQQLLCWLGFHSKCHKVERVYRLKDRPAPTPSYEGVPESAQIRAVYELSYIIDLWEDHEYCISCGRKVRVTEGTRRGRVQFNQMIYLENGQVFIVRPALIEG